MRANGATRRGARTLVVTGVLALVAVLVLAASVVEGFLPRASAAGPAPAGSDEQPQIASTTHPTEHFGLAGGGGRPQGVTVTATADQPGEIVAIDIRGNQPDSNRNPARQSWEEPTAVTVGGQQVGARGKMYRAAPNGKDDSVRLELDEPRHVNAGEQVSVTVIAPYAWDRREYTVTLIGEPQGDAPEPPEQPEEPGDGNGGDQPGGGDDGNGQGGPVEHTPEQEAILNKDPGKEDRQPPREVNTCEFGSKVWVAASRDQTPNRQHTSLYLQVQGSEEFEPILEDSPWVYNALAYNHEDNWLYAISQPRIAWNSDQGLAAGRAVDDPDYPAGHLLQINPETGEVHNLGKVRRPGLGNSTGFAGENAPGGPVSDLWGGISTGFFDGQGRYWVANGSRSGTHHFYEVNLDNRRASMKPAGSRLGDLSGNPPGRYAAQANDHAVLGEAPHLAWGIRIPFGDAEDKVIIERVNMDTGAVDAFDITDLEVPGTGETMPVSIYGTAWTYGNGNLGFGANDRGRNYQIKITDPERGGSNQAASDAGGILSGIGNLIPGVVGDVIGGIGDVAGAVGNVNTDSPTFELVAAAPSPTSYNNDAASNAFANGGAETDMRIEKTQIESEDGRVAWRITAENNGPCGSSGFSIRDEIPEGYEDAKIEDAGEAVASSDEAAVDGGGFLTATFGPLAAGDSQSIVISARPSNPEVCEANTAWVIGNEADPDEGNSSATAETSCEPEEPPIEDVGLSIVKVDPDGDGDFLDGAAFEIVPAGPDGEPVGEPIPVDELEAGRFGAALAPGSYLLVETRSPLGYELLARPVAFTIGWHEEDPEAPFVELLDPDNDGLVVEAQVRDGQPTLAVADVRQGTLPATGGRGVAPALVAAVLLSGAGLLLGRRALRG